MDISSKSNLYLQAMITVLAASITASIIVCVLLCSSAMFVMIFLRLPCVSVLYLLF